MRIPPVIPFSLSTRPGATIARRYSEDIRHAPNGRIFWHPRRRRLSACHATDEQRCTMQKKRNVHHTSTEDIVEMLSLRQQRLATCNVQDHSNASVQRAACNTVATWQPNRMQAQRQRTTIPPAHSRRHTSSSKLARALTHIYAHTFAHAKRALAHAYRRHADARKRGSITISTSWRRCDEPAWAREALKLFSAGGAGCCCCFLRCVCVRVRGHGHSNVPPDLTSIIYHSSARVCCTPQ
jgi:hypothetical protein